jgi:hypothetical protein
MEGGASECPIHSWGWFPEPRGFWACGHLLAKAPPPGLGLPRPAGRTSLAGPVGYTRGLGRAVRQFSGAFK